MVNLAGFKHDLKAECCWEHMYFLNRLISEHIVFSASISYGN